MAEGRQATAVPQVDEAAPAAPAGAAAADRRPTVSIGGIAQLKGLSAKLAASAGSAGSSAIRKSVVINLGANNARPGSPPARTRRSSSLAAALAGGAAPNSAAEHQAGSGSDGGAALHPALDRIKSFNRKKSAFRGGGGGGGAGASKALQFDDLAAAMDTLDERISGAVQQLRSQNAAGLGTVRGLARSKSGRARLTALSDSTDTADARRAAQAEDGGEPDGQPGTASPAAGLDTYSPRQLLGPKAVEQPEKLLRRMKFELKDEARVHPGGFITARGRLQGNAGDGDSPAAGSLIPAARQQSPATPLIGGQPSTADGEPGTDGQAAAVGAPQGPQTEQQVQQAQQAQQRGTPASRHGGAPSGMDKLAWVRNLVQFGEYKQREQLQLPGEPGAEAGGAAAAAGTQAGAAGAAQAPPSQPALDTIGWLDSGAGLRPSTSVPMPSTAASPAQAAAVQAARGPPMRTREEVALLQAWLQDMMAQVIAQSASGAADPEGPLASVLAASAGGASSGDPAATASALADAALWVYGMAFEELQRQITTECTDRGVLLGGMWQHVFNLVELRCSLVYESIICAIKEELQAARRQAAAAAGAARAAEERVKESMYYSRDKFGAMEAEVKSLAQLLAHAEDESTRHADEAALLRRAVDSQSSMRAAAEERAAEEHRRRVDAELRAEELQAEAAEAEVAGAARDAELAQLKGELQRVRAEGLALAEDKARLEVEVQRVQRDFQTSEILGLSLRERLEARDAELSDLAARHAHLQQEQAQASALLLESQASLSQLQVRHDSLQVTASQRVTSLEAELAAERGTLADVRRELGDTQAERAALHKSLHEAGVRETAATAQLKQLAGAHEQQTAKLRQETEARRTGDDELQALRSGLQVTQQRLEGLGVVFASAAMHRTMAEAWRAVGPISMGRQVVSAVNQQLGELSARKAELQHELGVAKERWQTEEGVRVRLQEQLLEIKARESKLVKEREGLDATLGRLEAQRASLDAEVAQMRRMLQDAESRCQSSHKKAMEAASEAKRLAPLEPQLARVQDALQGSHAELERLQREVTAHQSSIRKLLDEKSTALEQLAARNQALDAAQLQIRELSAASKDRLALADDKGKLEEQLHDLRQRCSATERLQSESMHQLTVARRLLADAHSADERARLAVTQQELQSTKVAAAATRRESLLLKNRLCATEEQLQFMERQLQVAVHAPLAAAVAAASAGSGPGGGGGGSGVVVEQLRRLLDTKEERIKQLERLQASLASSTAQVKHLQSELGARDGQVAQLQAEVEATRKRLHALQEAQAKAATKDLVALAAADPALPPEVAQSLALDYARNHLRSELAWTKAKLVFVSHMATQLRGKLQAAEDARTQAELESVCVEAHYLEQHLLEQRGFSATFSATFVQVKRALTSTLTAVAEMRRRLVAPATANLPQLAVQASCLAAALGTWVERFQGRRDESCQADPLMELAEWQGSMLGALGTVRPTSPPPLHHVSSIIVQLYAHRLRLLPLTGPSDTSAMLDNVYEAVAEFFCERRGFTRQAALSPTGPVTALLAGVRCHLQQPKQLLLGRLTGLVPSGGSGSSRSLQHPAAWQFFVRLLCCLRALHGAGWDALVKEWAEGEEGVPLPLPCVMDVLANLYNTDAPALLDSMRRGLLPLVRQGRRGPAVDLDAFLLVCMNEYCDGSCPVSPLALPRRLTDGTLASGTSPHPGSSSNSSNMGTCQGGISGLGNTVSGVAAAVGALPQAYPGAGGAAGDAQQQQQQRSPMRKRIVNLTMAAEGLPLVGPPRSPPLRCASPEPGGMQPGLAGTASGSSSPLATAVGAAGSSGGGGGATRSLQVLRGLTSLMASNPALPLGLRSSLRASAPNAPPAAATGQDK